MKTELDLLKGRSSDLPFKRFFCGISKLKNKKVFDFIYILKDKWQKLEKEETALIYEEIEMIHKIENIRTIPNYIEAKIFFHH
ncbi:hypothetical protein ACP3C5_002335 [Enterococcus faecium]